MEDNTEQLVKNAQSKVSETISAIEVAIATWNALEKKPEKLAKTMNSMERLLGSLEAWERKSLKNSLTPTETKKKDLKELIKLADSYKGDF